MNDTRPAAIPGERQRPVLVVGAGPTGLMLACELARLDIDVDLIDARDGPNTESRALVVHARTIERFDVLGIGDAAVSEGRPIDHVELAVRGRPAARLSLTVEGQQETEHPYLLVLEQSRTEALLLAALEELGRSVRWRTSLEDLVDRGEGVDVVLADAGEVRGEARRETRRYDWVVGCDGARSGVRREIGLDFVGGTYHQLFYLVDVAIDGPLPANAVMPSLAESSVALFVPMPGQRRYRVIGVLPAEVRGGNGSGEDGPIGVAIDGQPFRFETLEASLRSALDIRLRFSDVRWFSVFRVHHRCVERFREGRCLLAGDSAHVHSPIGGQGMNTGLQDATNLAWKLAMVIEGRVDPVLLDSFEEERLPVARGLLRTTDRLFSWVTERSWAIRHLRLRLLPTLARRLLANPRARRAMFRRLSQIGVRYRQSRLVTPEEAPIAKAVSAMARGRLAVRSGDRLPFATLRDPAGVGPPVALHRRLAAPGFHLLVLDRRRDPAPIAESWGAQLLTTPLGPVTLHSFGPASGADDLFEVLRVESAAVLLVRPDHYLGYVSARLSLPPLLRWVDVALPVPVPGSDGRD